jgi:hypothetical protein
LLYAAALHLLAGTLTGTIFKIRTLLMLCSLVFTEALILTLVHGQAAGLWALANLFILQIGYFAGLYGRSVLERTGYAPARGVRPGRRGYADR